MTSLIPSASAWLDWLANGLTGWSWWQILLFTLVVTHITIVSVTV